MDADQVAALRAYYADTGLDEADLASDPMDSVREVARRGGRPRDSGA